MLDGPELLKRFLTVGGQQLAQHAGHGVEGERAG
jgi:hypothetical protein